MNRIKMKEIIKTFGVFLVVAVVACGLVLPQSVSAALPAPNWLPGQPILAGNQIIAMWLPVPGAVKYIVYLDGKKIAELPMNQYMGLAPEAGGAHKYEVTAVDASGAESPLSKPGLVKIVIISPPKELLTRSRQESKAILLKWTNAPGAVIANVYRAEAKDGPYSLLKSIQGDNYKDSTPDVGKEYWYAVSSKDVTGKESGRSEPSMAILEDVKEDVAKVKVKIDMVVYPSREERHLSSLGLYSVADVSNVLRTSEGKLWIGTGGKALILIADESTMRVERVIKPAQLLQEQGLPFKNATNIDLIEGDRFVVVDGFVGTIYCFDIDGTYLWHTKPVLPPLDREELWVDLPEQIKSKKLLPNIPLFLEDGTLFVTEAQGPIVYIIDPDNGEIYDWWSGYDRDGEHFPSYGISSLKEVAPGTVWAGEPFGRRVVAFDADTREVKYVVGEESDGFIGGFLGIADIFKIPGEDVAIVADSGVGTLQAFDIKDGSYLYHFGGEKAEADPELSYERPIMDVGGMSIVFLTADRKLVTKHAFQKYLSVREVSWDKKEVIKRKK